MNAIEVPLSRFIDYVGAKNYDAKDRKVKEIKKQLEEDYSPIKDPYKPLREAIIAAGGEMINDKTMAELGGTSASTRVDLVSLAKRYNRLSHSIEQTTQPKRAFWEYPTPFGLIRIKVNPDLAIKLFGDEKFIQTKFYFKSNPPDKRQVRIAYQVMSEALRLPADQLGIIALRRSLTPPKNAIIPVHPSVGSLETEKLLRREAAYFVMLWTDS